MSLCMQARMYVYVYNIWSYLRIFLKSFWLRSEVARCFKSCFRISMQPTGLNILNCRKRVFHMETKHLRIYSSKARFNSSNRSADEIQGWHLDVIVQCSRIIFNVIYPCVYLYTHVWSRSQIAYIIYHKSQLYTNKCTQSKVQIVPKR